MACQGHAAHRKDLQHAVEVVYGAAYGRADVDVDDGRPRAVRRQPVAQLIVVDLAAGQRRYLQLPERLLWKGPQGHSAD